MKRRQRALEASLLSSHPLPSPLLSSLSPLLRLLAIAVIIFYFCKLIAFYIFVGEGRGEAGRIGGGRQNFGGGCLFLVTHRVAAFYHPSRVGTLEKEPSPLRLKTSRTRPRNRPISRPPPSLDVILCCKCHSYLKLSPPTPHWFGIKILGEGGKNELCSALTRNFEEARRRRLDSSKDEVRLWEGGLYGRCHKPVRRGSRQVL